MKDFYLYPFDEHQIIQTPNLWQTYQNYNYMISFKGKAYVIDPGDLNPIENTLTKNNLELAAIYLTHHHPDHVGATKVLAEKFQCPVYGFAGDKHRLPALTQTYENNEILNIANLEAQVMHLPGHTTGLCAFYIKEKNWLFSNDLIFSLGCGRVFEGTHEQMFTSLQTVAQLPNETLIFSSHEYTLSNLNFSLSLFPADPKLAKASQEISQKLSQQHPTVPTTLGFEKKANLFLRCQDPSLYEVSEASQRSPLQNFIDLRTKKDRF